MAKKRKLNSKNPKYITQAQDDSPKIKKKVLFCNVNPRNERTGKKDYGVSVPVYGVWYEDDE